MRIDVITLFPAVVEGALREGMLKRAAEKGLVSYHVHNLRDYSVYPRGQVDDRPYGGGPGMLLMPDPVFRAVEAVEGMDGRRALRIALTPRGETYTQRTARALSREERLLLLCGRYEGFDQRIIDGLKFREISIGDYVLSGGEIPALVVIESVVRLVPGVLGNEESPLHESFSDEGGVTVEHPQYTRPAVYRGMKVPEVLLSGDHARIEAWRKAHTSVRRTPPPREGAEGA